MDNVEKKVFDALAQAPYKVTLGGKEFEFRPMSLSDRQEISAISDSIPIVEISEGESDTLKDAIEAGKHSRQIAEIISVGAHIRGDKVRKAKIGNIIIPWQTVTVTEKEQRDELFRHVYENTPIDEIYEAVKLIFVNSHPAFFLNIITSLCPRDILKPTKEIEATAPGQSKPE